jgi:hypothetical protein
MRPQLARGLAAILFQNEQLTQFNRRTVPVGTLKHLDHGPAFYRSTAADAVSDLLLHRTAGTASRCVSPDSRAGLSRRRTIPRDCATEATLHARQRGPAKDNKTCVLTIG